MAGRALHFTALGPLEPGSRAHLGIELAGGGQPALPVVLVFLPAEVTRDAGVLADLQRQTESAQRLKHPNLIRVIGLEQLEEGWARIVEFADAESLRKLLGDAQSGRKEKVPPGVAAAILADACLGVHAAHETGEAGDPRRPLVHGGLRPETLLVTHAGRTKVTGYGAQVFAPAGKDAARDAFVAPEQVLGGRDAMSRGTDVYALGAILYEALAGVPPFTAEEGLLETLILSTAPNPRRLAEAPELAEIALKALSKKAADRYPTALAMREALLSCRSTPPASPDVVSRWVEGLFPPSHPARAARRELLESALSSTGPTTLPPELLAEVQKPPAPAPVPTPPLPEARPAPQKTAQAKAFSESSIVPYVPSVSEQVEIQRDRSKRGLTFGLLAGMAGGLLAWGVWKATRPPPPEPERPAAVDSGTAEAPDAGAPAAADAGLPVVAPVPDAGAPAAVDAGAPSFVLEVSTDPPMDIKVDGNRIGSGSARASLPPGRHRIEASNRSLRVYAARDIDLTKDHQRESFEIGQGQLVLDVPPGAKITIDGKEIGTAPLPPQSLYAGTHDVDVEYNEAETSQKIPIHEDMSMTLTVHAH